MALGLVPTASAKEANAEGGKLSLVAALSRVSTGPVGGLSPRAAGQPSPLSVGTGAAQLLAKARLDYETMSALRIKEEEGLARDVSTKAREQWEEAKDEAARRVARGELALTRAAGKVGLELGQAGSKVPAAQAGAASDPVGVVAGGVAPELAAEVLAVARGEMAR